ncbi:MAG: FKBP-type peptidyl-prolyl cis-trans isomerase [Sphingobacterium sp.]|uniref:FKBP-type peptidyl-prolyl cis-trans isomerase n=1 Tax=Sphingobacterium sp. JB170 TaxID=1434842 RepID=UPI00097F3345|nr:FKBP-type peptidyl-prolyl cis-trans isomerase [Sphingobacterium sp. JB170]SJN49433.1 FKBP-type peptidyl-prolyl cis-trans isomerase FkpA precursor [Sphingobacterium sp. JB170]
MIKSKIIGYAGLTLLFWHVNNSQAQELTSNLDSVSYALGLDVGASLLKGGMEIDDVKFQRGVSDALAGNSELFNEEERIRIIKNAFNKAAEQRAEEMKEVESDFFASIQGKPNLKSAVDGLYYEVLREGTGTKPMETDEVTVHYKGSLVDGKVFDNSYDRGEPMELGLDRVIRGWQLGIPLMSVGSKYRFYIPSSLGYGERGAGGDIPPHSPLVFEIELIGIKENAVN